MAGTHDTSQGPLLPGHPDWPTGPPLAWPSGPPPAGNVGGWGAAPPDPGAGGGGARRGLVGAVVALVVIAVLAGAATLVATSDDPDDDAASTTTTTTAPSSIATTEPSPTDPTPPSDERAWSASTTAEPTTVVADDERIYVLDDDPFVEAFDAESGEWLWERELFGFPQTLIPMTGGQLLLGTEEDEGDLTTYLLDAVTGEEIWAVEGMPVLEYRGLGTGLELPITASEIVLVTTPGPGPQVRAIDRESGVERWRAPGDSGILCGEVVVTMLTDLEQSTAETVGRSPVDGSVRWTVPGLTGACRGDEVGIVGDGKAVVVGSVAGDTRVSLPVDTTPDVWSALLTALGGGVIPLGDHIAVQHGPMGVETSVLPRSGGPATWSGDAVPVPVPLTDGILLVDLDQALFRVDTDGRESERFGIVAGCDPWFGEATVTGCDGSAVVTVSLEGEPAETGRIEVGAPVEHVVVAGGRTIAVTADGSMRAYD